AEAARVVEDHAGSRPRCRDDIEDDMVMRTVLRTLVVEIAGRVVALRRFDAKRSRHAEMADKAWPAIRLHRQIFGAAPQRDDRPAGQAFGEFFGKRKAQIGTPRLDADDTRAFQNRLQAPP